jgi:hypothetical protein
MRDGRLTTASASRERREFNRRVRRDFFKEFFTGAKVHSQIHDPEVRIPLRHEIVR